MNTERKIRFIKIQGLKEENIAEAYNGRDKCPIYIITTDPWQFMRNWNVNTTKKVSKNKQYDATMISVVLEEVKSNFKYADMQHLLSMIYSIKNESEIVYLCFRQDCQKNQNDYFRLSAFLKLWLIQNNMFENTRFYDTSDLSTYAIKRMALKFDYRQSEMKSYTSFVSNDFFPIIGISDYVYNILDEDYCLSYAQNEKEILETLRSLLIDINSKQKFTDKPKSNEENVKIENYIKAYLYAYIEKTLENVSQEQIWLNFINNYKPSIIVVALIATMLKEAKSKKKRNDSIFEIFDEEQWIGLIECCYSYAQGILQLIDNANKHIIRNNNKNAAFFGFLMRDDKNNILNNYETINDDYKHSQFFNKYFLETFIIDVDFSSQNGIGIISKYNKTLKNAKIETKINSLEEIFNYPETISPALKEYYDDTKNIAYHYGLQIFSGIIKSNNGILIVTSGSECKEKDIKNITYSNDRNNIYKNVDSILHFAGTSYRIILPIIMPKKRTDEYNYFLGNISIGTQMKKDLKICKLVFESKDDENLNEILYYNNEDILHVDFTNVTDRKFIEIAGKNLLVKLIEERNMKALCLTGFKNEYLLLDVMRVILLFYNKLGKFDKIKDKGIFLYCNYNSLNLSNEKNNKEFEIYFNGSNINSILQNVHRQKLIKNVPELFIKEIESALHYKQNYEYAPGDSLPSALIKYNVVPYKWRESIIQKQIKDILYTDIHHKPLGCKISDTHVRIGQVHLDTFYEAQFLFGNAYCTDIFALFVADHIQKQIKQKPYKNVILYGYESYSTLTLYKTQAFLNGITTEMLVYEKDNERVRYLKKESIKEDTLVVYVMGISSTLSTFEQMNKAFIKACNDENLKIEMGNIDKVCLSIIQIVGEGSEKFIKRCNTNTQFCESMNGYINFALDAKAYYFVEVESSWYSAEKEDCIYCLPETENRSIFDERPLIEVDDTSVVPTQMIFFNESEKNNNFSDQFEQKYVKKFLENKANEEYLRYGHIERYDNHFQYFFRIAALYHDKQNDIEQWLIELRKKYAETFDLSPKTVNILIAPQHFSNTGYVNSVAKCVFGGSAHIIELDIRKEYRSNFCTKYSNYRELANVIENYNGYRLDFYYVNDQIITGKTFKRAESLIRTLLGKNSDNFINNGFKGIFTVIDRHSYETKKAYVNPIIANGKEYLPFFSYLKLNIPSLRNHDNSCPLCNKSEEMNEIVSSTAFASTMYFWQKKIVNNRPRTSDMIRVLDKRRQDLVLEGEEKVYRERSFRRLQCENEIWYSIPQVNNVEAIFDHFMKIIILREIKLIDLELKRTGHNKINTQRKNIIKKRKCDLQKNIEGSNNSAIEQIKEYFTCLNNMPKKILFDLFKTIIMRLCTIGSCVLLNHERLKKCLEIGHYFESIIKKGECDKDASCYESEFGEYLISYVKIISRPLLFYREPVKKAALRILLIIFDKIINGCCINSDEIQKNHNEYNNINDNSYYDQTFNGFLLNSLKRLLCYDKGVSKCNYCDQYAFNDESCLKDEFYKRLYIENNRKVLIDCKKSADIKQWPFSEKDKKMQIYDKNGNTTGKYSYIASCLQKECQNKENQCENIAFFVADEFEKSYIWIGGNRKITPPSMDKLHKNKDYYETDEGIIFIRIGNNYDRFKDNKNDVYNSCEELGLMQDASVILGYRKNDKNYLNDLRSILAFRKEILREVEKDFNNGTVRKTILFQVMAKSLTSPGASSHNKAAHESYHLAFKNVEKIEDDKDRAEAQYHIISAYSSLIISECYRSLSKRSIERNDISYTIEMEKDRNDSRIKFDVKDLCREKIVENACAIRDVDLYIKHVIFMLKHKEFPMELKILYGEKDNYKLYDFHNEDEDKDFELFFEGYEIQDLFPYEKQYFYIFMILDILIKNIESHCPENLRGDNFAATIKFVKSTEKNIDLMVENQYNKNWDDQYKGNGITLYALANLFGTKEREGQSYPETTLFYTGIYGDQSKTNDFSFVVKLSNFINKINM